MRLTIRSITVHSISVIWYTACAPAFETAAAASVDVDHIGRVWDLGASMH